MLPPGLWHPAYARKADADEGTTSRGLGATGTPLLVSVPSLVEHDAAPSVASSDRFPDWLRRVAVVPIGDYSGLDVDWSHVASMRRVGPA